MTTAIRRAVCAKGVLKQLHGLSYFKAADEDRLVLLLEFDYHTLENLPYDLIII